MEAQLLTVKTPNKMLFIKGKLSRTPFKAIIISESELKILKSSMKLQSIEYTIEKYVKPEKKAVPIKQLRRAPKIEKPKKIESPSSILESISNETIE
jgi:hypothetical protein